jgi:hypothetical protein
VENWFFFEAISFLIFCTEANTRSSPSKKRQSFKGLSLSRLFQGSPLPTVYNYKFTISIPSNSLTNNQSSVFREVIFRNLQVQWSGSFSYTSRNIVVRSVARTEPSTVVTGFTDGDTSKMCADTYLVAC